MFFNFLILLLAVPVGFLIAWLGRDELIQGRKYFRILIIVSILGSIFSFIYLERFYLYSFLFVLIVSLISLIKSEDKKWTKKRV